MKEFAMPRSFMRLFSWAWFPSIFFIILSFALYGISLFGDFVYDDSFFYQNGALRSWEYLRQTWWQPSLDRISANPHYRPLTFASFALNYIFTGESPFGFRVINVLLNGCTSWALFVLIRRLFGSVQFAWMVACLFALFPIHAESVAYIKARDEILVALFGLMAWIQFLQAVDTKNQRPFRASLVSSLFILAAAFSKESAVVWPGVMAGTLLLQRGFAALRHWRPVVMHACALAVFLFMRHIATGAIVTPEGEILYFGQNPLGYLPYAYVPWTAAELLFVAVSQTFVPWNLSATYGFAHIPLVSTPFGYWMAPAGIVVAFLLLLSVLIPAIRRGPIGVGVLTFLILYFPFSKIPFHVSIDFFAERWLYAPSIGLAIIGGYLLLMLWRTSQSIGLACTSMVVALYITILIPRTLVWTDEVRLGESMVRDAPNSVIAYVFLANQRLQAGRLQEATDLVTRGLSISRDHLPIHHIAASLALSIGMLEVAENAVSAAEEIGGDELANVILRCTLLAKQGEYQASLDHLRSSRWFDTSEFRVRMLLALNLWMLGQKEEARQYFDWDRHLPVTKLTDEEKILMFETYAF